MALAVPVDVLLSSNHLPAERRLRRRGRRRAVGIRRFQSPSRRKAIATRYALPTQGAANFQSPSRRKAIATTQPTASYQSQRLPITFPPKGDCDNPHVNNINVATTSNHLPAERRLRLGLSAPPVWSPASNHLPAERRLRLRQLLLLVVEGDFQSPSRRKAIATCRWRTTPSTTSSNHLPAERRLRPGDGVQVSQQRRLPITFPPKGDCDSGLGSAIVGGASSNHLPAERRLRRRRRPLRRGG